MAFPVGWGRKCPITIDHTKVGATLTDFPVLLTEDNLPSEMFDADGSNPALNGGGDIRFSSDAYGVTRLACEIVSLVTDNDPANGSAEIWVKIPSLSSSTDTVIYVWYNKSGESQPAVDDTYGRNAVWGNYVGVWHMSQDPSGSAPQIFDSTGNGNSGTSSGTMTTSDLVDAKVGKGLEFDDVDDKITVDDTAALKMGTSDFSVSCWVKATSPGFIIWKKEGLASTLGYGFYMQSPTAIAWRITEGENDVYVSLPSLADSLKYIVMTADRDNNLSAYVDAGAPITSSMSSVGDIANTSPVTFGQMGGILDEVRITNKLLSPELITTEYNNQSAPFSFATAGTPGLTYISPDLIGRIKPATNITARIKPSTTTAVRTKPSTTNTSRTKPSTNITARTKPSTEINKVERPR